MDRWKGPLGQFVITLMRLAKSYRTQFEASHPGIEARVKDNNGVDLKCHSFETDKGSYHIGDHKGGRDEAMVYRGLYKGTIDCALKFVGQPKAIPPDRLRDLLGNEVMLLSRLRHTNLTKILDFGLARINLESDAVHAIPMPNREKQLTYIAMDYVPGEHFSSFWKEMSTEQFLDVMEQVLDGVEYLHQRGVLHMDLKPSNVLVEKTPGGQGGRIYRPVLIDLGFSVVADAEKFERYFGKELASKLDAEEPVYVQFDKDYASSDDIRDYRDRGVVRREVLEHMFPKHDLFSIGRIIEEFVNAKAEDKQQTQDVSLEGLSTISKRLKGSYYLERSGDNLVAASLVWEDIRKLKAGFAFPFGIPELSMASQDGISIELSKVSVPITPRIRMLVDHRFFQRLRKVPQLEYVSWLYPDANHTRFSHCLLTYHLTRLALIHMLNDPRFRLEVDKEDLEAVLIFALLHDIGHYPLSHMFEDLRLGSHEQDKILSDEDLFLSVIGVSQGDESSDVDKKVDGLLEGDRSLSSIIRDERFFGERTYQALRSLVGCAYLREEASKPIHRLLGALVSSPLDMDKAAYLTLDSSMTGVPYGMGIDLRTYMAALDMPETLVGNQHSPAKSDEEEESKRKKGPLLSIDPKGLAAAESLIMSRYWMLSRVYWWHTNRSIQAAFKFVILELRDGERNILPFLEYFNETFWQSEDEAAKWLSDLFDKLNDENPSLFNPVKAMLRSSRKPYKRLVVISKGARKENDLYKRIVYLDQRSERELAHKVTKELGKFLVKKGLNQNPEFADFFADGAKLKDGVLVVDIPRKPRDALDFWQVQVHAYSLGDESGDKTRDKDLDKVSPLMHELGDEFLNEVKKFRIFIYPRLAELLRENGILKDSSDHLKGKLESIVSGLGG